ncbi:stage II sporulation protein M [Candidatus Bathyarchaeota archaeon]|nr:stage II sporulation protein M [Candidatus Bathyarchaeota archaeon]
MNLASTTIVEAMDSRCDSMNGRVPQGSGDFFLDGLRVLKANWIKILIFNILYFGAFTVGVIYGLSNPAQQLTLARLVQIELRNNPTSRIVLDALMRRDMLTATVFTFIHNLIYPALLISTCGGLLILPLILNIWQYFILGVIFSPTTMAHVFVLTLSFPVLLMETESYVFASIVGLNLTLGLIKPNLLYKDMKLTRKQALRQSLNACVAVYIWIITILLVSAAIEIFTLTAI